MKQSKVLVFPGGSEIGLELFRSLHQVKEVDLWGGTSVTSDHGHYLFAQYLTGIPYVDADEFVPALNRAAAGQGIEFIFPAHDSVVLKLAEAQATGYLQCGVITSPLATCSVCRSKRATYDLFRNRLRVPVEFPSVEQVPEWPIFLKPDVGQGSRGVSIARGAADVHHAVAKDPTLMLLEYLPGPEYTIDCFTDRQGELRFVGARERLRIQNGISVDTRQITNLEFLPIAQAINAGLHFRGMWFFQAKRDASGALALLEIAPRVSGTMGLFRALGVNLPLLALHDVLGHDIEIHCNAHELRLDRALAARYRHTIAFRHVYVDLDDCLIIRGRINTELGRFLMQCVNRGIKLHLVTRHAGDPHETLALHRLGGLFDNVTHLRLNEPKSHAVTEPNAIFIDDSFRERAEVAGARNIPVFAPDAVESLLDESYG